MLVTFKSKAAADVPMYAEHAQALLALVGKTLEPVDAPRGIITAADVPQQVGKAPARTRRYRGRRFAAADQLAKGAVLL